MKKVKALLLLIFTLWILSVAALSGGCVGEIGGPMSAVTLTGARLQWEEISGAEQYYVNIMFSEVSGYEIAVNDTKYVINHANPGEYRYKVRAKVRGGFTSYSETFVYKLGDGSIDNPITVGSPEELSRISTGLRTVKNEDNEDISVPIYYEQTNDIDLENQEWTPIGLSNNIFKGVYDGRGYTIKNLKITKLSGTGTNVAAGLFGLIQDAVIKNVNIVEPDIKITHATTQFSVGALVGRSTTSVIKNCSVIGDLAINAPATGENILYAGLVIGESRGTGMSELLAIGNIAAVYSRVYAGGIVGITKTSSADIINNCAAYVNITTHGTGRSSSSVTAVSYAGGIAGYLSYANAVEYCYFTGSLTATAIDGTLVENINKGMFGGSQNSSSRANILLKACYFNIEDFGLEYNATYPTASAIAEMYAVGNCTKLKLGSSAFGITGEAEALEETFSGFDFDNIWEIKDGKPTIRARVMPIILPMSEVTLQDNLITWAAVAGATEYYVHNITKDTKTTVYNLNYSITESAPGEYRYRIGAKTIGELTAYSEVMIYSILEPEGPQE